MGNIHLVTGYAGGQHVTAADQGAFNAALIGPGQFVLDKGKVFEPLVVNNNQIRVQDGELMMQGRFVRLDPGTYVDLSIENGVQGKKRNDLIVARYTKNTVTGVEGVDLIVIKGTSVENNPADPAHTVGDITNGASALHDFPLWRIPIDGLNVGSPVALFGDPFMDSMRTLPEIRNQVESIHEEVDEQLEEQNRQIDEKIAGITSYTQEETLKDETKESFNLDTDAVPDDVFKAIAEFQANSIKIATGSYVGTGTYGRNNPCALTFDFEPKFVMVYKDAMGFLFSSDDESQDSNTIMAAYGASSSKRYAQINSRYSHGVLTDCFAWGDTSFSWYTSFNSSEMDATAQLNEEGTTYYYLAIG